MRFVVVLRHAAFVLLSSVATSPVAAITPPAPVIDADRDGIPDHRDACVIELRVPVTPNGCPDLARMNLSSLKFRPATFGLLSESFPLLNAVAASIKANPALYVQVGGYAEAPAKASLNLWKRRAESVIDYLVANGVNPDQLEARGYGVKQGAGRIALRVF